MEPAIVIVIAIGDADVVGEIIFDREAKLYEGVITRTVFAAYYC